MSIKLSQKQIVILGAGAVLLISIVFLIFLNMRAKPNTNAQVKLTVWGMDDKGIVGPIFSAFPYAQVNYIQIDSKNYTSQLLSALAAGNGPDVFEIGNRELPKWKSVTAPIPAAYAQQFGALRLSQIFPDVVAQDFVSDGQIYGLPLSIDTLVMVYNKDLMNSAGIAIQPKTWEEFDANVAKLRALNTQGQLTQAAAAIGGSRASIPYAADILSLLMLQNGTEMARFASDQNGAAAFNFYLQFANAASPYYSWTDALGNSLDSFVAGKTAIIFAYQSDLASVKAKAPFLNIGIAPVPQAKGASVSVNYPRYRGFVAAKAGQVGAAWNFILYFATTDAAAKRYLDAVGAPPATRAGIQAKLNDPVFSVFASQALTAKSWYEADDAKIDGILDAAIQNVLHGAEDSSRALREAETAVNQLKFKGQ